MEGGCPSTRRTQTKAERCDIAGLSGEPRVSGAQTSRKASERGKVGEGGMEALQGGSGEPIEDVQQRSDWIRGALWTALCIRVWKTDQRRDHL